LAVKKLTAKKLGTYKKSCYFCTAEMRVFLYLGINGFS